MSTWYSDQEVRGSVFEFIVTGAGMSVEDWLSNMHGTSKNEALFMATLAHYEAEKAAIQELNKKR